MLTSVSSKCLTPLRSCTQRTSGQRSHLEASNTRSTRWLHSFESRLSHETFNTISLFSFSTGTGMAREEAEQYSVSNERSLGKIKQSRAGRELIHRQRVSEC